MLEIRNKNFMKPLVEENLKEREKFALSLRKKKRSSLFNQTRGLALGEQEKVKAERAEILKNLTEFLREKGILCNGLEIEEISMIISDDLPNEDFDCEPVLNFFYMMVESNSLKSVLVKYHLLDPLVILINFTEKVTDILRVLINACDNHVAAAKELIEIGIFDQLKLLIKRDRFFVRQCAYVMYRLLFIGKEFLHSGTLAVAVDICRILLEYEESKLHVYYSLNVIASLTKKEDCCRFAFQDMAADLKKNKFVSVILRVFQNICAGPNEIILEVLDLGLLDLLSGLLACEDKARIVKICCNIAAGDNFCRSKILLHEIFLKIVKLINYANSEIKGEVSEFFSVIALKINPLMLPSLLKEEVFFNIKRALGHYPDVDMNYLNFFYQVFDKKNFLAEGKELFVESGCIEAVEKLCYRDEVMGQAQCVLNRFSEYIK